MMTDCAQVKKYKLLAQDEQQGVNCDKQGVNCDKQVRQL